MAFSELVFLFCTYYMTKKGLITRGFLHTSELDKLPFYSHKAKMKQALGKHTLQKTFWFEWQL